jgi:hypothetical protein
VRITRAPTEAVADLPAHERADEDDGRRHPDGQRRAREREPERLGHVEHDEGLQRRQRQLPERVGDQEGLQVAPAAHEIGHVAHDLADRLLLDRPLASAVANARDAEGAHRQPDDEGGSQEGQQIGDRDEQAAADEGEERPEAAEDGLAALGAPGDLVVDEVGVEGAIGLVGDEVRDEEDRDDDRGLGDRLDEAQHGQRDDERRSRGEDEGQPAAQRRAQPVRPRAAATVR